MRGLPVRRIASTALCATLVLGIAGPAAMAADHDPARERTPATSQAPVADAKALLGQTQTLNDLGVVLDPVTKMLDAVLKADEGQLSAEEAKKLGDAAKASIAKLGTAASAAPAAPAAPAVPAVPAAPSAPTVPSTSNAPIVTLPAPASLVKNDPAASATDVRAGVLDDLQKAIDALIEAATSGLVDQVVPAATAVVTGLVNVLTTTLVGGALPAHTVAGLPPLPSLPAAEASAPQSSAALPEEPSADAEAAPAQPQSPVALPEEPSAVSEAAPAQPELTPALPEAPQTVPTVGLFMTP
ncbi:hypothetical protein ACWDV7_00075 [Streptomyces sp. NPDC003362]